MRRSSRERGRRGGRRRSRKLERDEADEAELRRVAREFVAPLTLHEARHTFASLMIAAGVNSKSLSTYLGHSSIAITVTATGI